MQVKVSVIIPVYNAENHLRQCLDSLLDQGVAEDFYEIICINDGSKDSSFSILKDYADRHANMVVINKENEGVSAARNRGLDIARGEYVWFIDADDWVARGFLGNGIAEALRQGHTHNPLLLTKCIEVRENEAGQYTEYAINADEIGTENVSPFMTTSRGHFFARSLIEKYRMRYDVNLAYGEDLMFMREFLDAVRFENEEYGCGYQMLQCNGKGSYLYRLHSKSVMGRLAHCMEKVADSLLYRARASNERFKEEDKPTWYRANYQEYVNLFMQEYMLYYFPALNKPLRAHLKELKSEGLYPAPPPKLGWTKPRGLVQNVQRLAFRYSAVYPLYYWLLRIKFKKAGTV